MWSRRCKLLGYSLCFHPLELQLVAACADHALQARALKVFCPHAAHWLLICVGRVSLRPAGVPAASACCGSSSQVARAGTCRHATYSDLPLAAEIAVAASALARLAAEPCRIARPRPTPLLMGYMQWENQNFSNAGGPFSPRFRLQLQSTWLRLRHSQPMIADAQCACPAVTQPASRPTSRRHGAQLGAIAGPATQQQHPNPAMPASNSPPSPPSPGRDRL